MSRLLTPAAVADVLAVSSRTVRRLLDTGELPGLRVGKLWRVDPDMLAEWQRARETGNPERGPASAPAVAATPEMVRVGQAALARQIGGLPDDYEPVYPHLLGREPSTKAAASPAAGRTRSAKRNRKPA